MLAGTTGALRRPTYGLSRMGSEVASPHARPLVSVDGSSAKPAAAVPIRALPPLENAAVPPQGFGAPDDQSGTEAQQPHSESRRTSAELAAEPVDTATVEVPGTQEPPLEQESGGTAEIEHRGPSTSPQSQAQIDAAERQRGAERLSNLFSPLDRRRDIRRTAALPDHFPPPSRSDGSVGSTDSDRSARSGEPPLREPEQIGADRTSPTGPAAPRRLENIIPSALRINDDELVRGTDDEAVRDYEDESIYSDYEGESVYSAGSDLPPHDPTNSRCPNPSGQGTGGPLRSTRSSVSPGSASGP